MSDEPEGWTIFIDVPDDAPEAEREAFFDAVADAALGFEQRTGWDPFKTAHRHDCCCGRALAAPPVPSDTPKDEAINTASSDYAEDTLLAVSSTDRPISKEAAKAIAASQADLPRRLKASRSDPPKEPSQ